MLAMTIPRTDEDLSEMLKENFGWCWPPYVSPEYPQQQFESFLVNLPPPVIRYFRKLNPENQQRLLRFKSDKQSIRNAQELEEVYRRTWTIRWIFLETINRLYLNDFIDDSPAQFWDDDNLSELYWLRLMDLLATKKNHSSNSSDPPKEYEKKEDYPVNIKFTPCHPLQTNRPISTNHHVQVESTKHFNVTDGGPRFWTIGFQDTTCNNPKLHDICFKRKNPFPNIMLSNHIDRLGHIWIEKSRDNDQKCDRSSKKFRVLFQKTCSDVDLGLFLWPQFNLKKIGSILAEQSDLPPDTPKIPIYQDSIVELCDQDRLILFATEYRSHRVFINLQIAIEFSWASEFDDSENQISLREKEQDISLCKPEQECSAWIDNILQWPNPCERYSHYVTAPSSYPELEVDKEEQATSDTRIEERQLEGHECLEQETMAQSKDQLATKETGRGTSRNECLFESEDATNASQECRDQDDQASIPPSDCTSERPVRDEVNSLSVNSSATPILCDSGPASSAWQVKVSAGQPEDPQPVLRSGDRDIAESQDHERTMPGLRQGKQNNCTRKESGKINNTGKSLGSEKSVRRKSPRLIELAHSNKPTTSKRRRI
ncbi:hypothetical protein MJO28_004089 [Puccinia striiformis f. sp. tritici]|uniref:Uncharacterized protein n=2 Tax=Puccinia striiformis f. sp. tritici TaxID=168172 RepID=A0A0L0VPB8_9BASI|nr:hypothetical protein Pst134EA_007285 [Puccinia striiformis f. sp. tritici]XP_047809489.1 hypothetical protein Pst134EA_007299 [Puccinia striiformis f. sp. tritici]KNF01128.1 hypothetical protein PSTG_05756 [Puccinia striiformis f. sp. tritici PST-78]KAH9460250.1 hypothetical protein Pst134EB_008435 [Puccinia striiformis f. sp. tritici]KAH9470021.1 hypothetical protein Pst134EA_007285 [Puccinia striiformis f. sp. tritici]KAH9470035.1 hypothetical protein Pst134EA_007299 [Puccinia striiformis